MFDIWTAIIQGIVEGLTEFLPISSTGHLILTGHLLNFTGKKADSFEIVIQLGAILAVAILYWRRLFSLVGLAKRPSERKQEGGLNIWHVLIAIIPAALLGAIFHSAIKEYLFRAETVLIGLVVGGIFLIYGEKKQTVIKASELDDLSYKQVLQIGLFQCLSLWPGFSRSGATIAGGMLSGATLKASADFSFLIAVPIMVAASGYDLLKSRGDLSMDDFGFFAVGFIVSFIVALLAVATFLKLLNRIKLTTFAYYRFGLAAVFLVYLIVTGMD